MQRWKVDSVRCDPRPGGRRRWRPPRHEHERPDVSPIDLRVAELPEVGQQIYYCLAIAGESGLSDGELLEMLGGAVGFRRYSQALSGLLATGMVNEMQAQDPRQPRHWRAAEEWSQEKP